MFDLSDPFESVEELSDSNQKFSSPKSSAAAQSESTGRSTAMDQSPAQSSEGVSVKSINFSEENL